MEYKLSYQLEVSPLDGDKADVVKVVHWRYGVVDGKYKTDIYGAVGLDSPDEDFIPFDSLTDANIVEWLGSKLDFEELKKTLDEKLDRIKNPLTVIKELKSKEV